MANELPSNLEAERAVLGSCILDTDAILLLQGKLDPDDFFLARHRLIFEAMLTLARRGTPLDYLTVHTELENTNQLGAIGGGAYLTELYAAVPTSAHVQYYAEQLRATRLRREAIAAATQIAKDAYANSNSAAVIEAGRKLVAELAKLATQSSDAVSLKASCDLYLDILSRRETEANQRKLSFPWPSLAELMPHLDGGTLCAVIAEPGVGKTAFLEYCAEKWARAGWRVAFFHFELSTAMMLDRRMQRHSGVSIARLQSAGDMDSDEYNRVISAVTSIAQWSGNIHYVHCPGWTMAQVVGMAEQLHDTDGIDVVIVDYLNKVRLRDQHGMNTAQLRGADIEELKTALEQNGFVGLMAAQFDKAAKRAPFRSLADARDTGELEDKSNVGLVLERPRDDRGQRDNQTQCRVVKCNAGKEGTIDLWFDGERLSFIPVQREPLDA